MTTAAAPIRRILVPTDFSACAAAALDYAVALARPLGAEIHVCHCSTLPDYDVANQVSPSMRAAATGLVQQLGELFKHSREEMAQVLDHHRGQGVTLSDSYVEGYPDEGIVQRAREWGADLIVIGSHGRKGLSRALLGSVAEHVLRHAPCPVLVVHKDAPR